MTLSSHSQNRPIRRSDSHGVACYDLAYMESPTYDRRLSKVQMKEAFELASAIGLDAAAFRLIEKTGHDDCLVHEFQHPDTRSFFRFDWSIRYRTGFSLTWWPSADGVDPSEDADSLAEAMQLFKFWLQSVKAETETPDVWALAREQRAWLTSTEKSFAGNTPFSNVEKEMIARHLRTIEEHTIRTFNLQGEEAAYVRERLNYLSEAAGRVGRFDWKGLALSTFFGIVTSLAMEPEKARTFLGFVSKLLGPLVSGAIQLLS